MPSNFLAFATNQHARKTMVSFCCYYILRSLCNFAALEWHLLEANVILFLCNTAKDSGPFYVLNLPMCG